VVPVTDATGRPAASARTDAELLELHAGGDPDAFAEVVRRHRDRLWAVALRTLGDREDAADALQDALVKAYRSANSAAGFRGEAAVTTWLHRVVVNACLDSVRRSRSRPAVPLPDTEAGLPVGADRIAQRETALVVQDALATLPLEQRAALVLVDMQGWSVAEAADILGVAPGTVKSRCARGRARLVPLLRGPEPARNRAGDAGVPCPGPGSSGSSDCSDGSDQGGEPA
jgi:RNA polymerase sigma-70 factor (ECF subfamily)